MECASRTTWTSLKKRQCARFAASMPEWANPNCFPLEEPKKRRYARPYARDPALLIGMGNCVCNWADSLRERLNISPNFNLFHVHFAFSSSSFQLSPHTGKRIWYLRSSQTYVCQIVLSFGLPVLYCGRRRRPIVPKTNVLEVRGS